MYYRMNNTQEAIAIELQLKQKRRQEKLSNYITSGLQVTQTEIEREFVGVTLLQN